MKFIKWFEKNIVVILITGFLLILILPSILSLPALFPILNLTKGRDIGSTIGGITAPIIGTITCLLLFITFRRQSDFNQKQISNQHYQSIELMVTETWKLVDEMEWNSYRGVKALLFFKLNENKTPHTLFDEFYTVLLRFEIILKLMDNIKEENMKVIFLKRIYTLYYSKILWNTRYGFFKEMKDNLHKHHETKLSLLLYADISLKTLKYLEEQNITYQDKYKQGVKKEFSDFIIKANEFSEVI